MLAVQNASDARFVDMLLSVGWQPTAGLIQGRMLAMPALLKRCCLQVDNLQLD